MRFRTEINPGKSEFRITHTQQILSLGSCFAEHIGGLLGKYKFNCQLNPFGITYNPAAIAQSIETLRAQRLYDQSDLFEDKGIWSSLDHHSSFSASDPAKVVASVNAEIEKGHNQLPNLDLLILTFGTAHVFYHRDKNRIVNNCHKLSTSYFDRKLLSVDDVFNALADQLSALKSLSPSLKVILTVSPVRHLRDGLVKSKLSKATLLVATHQLANHFDFVEYFPAYEMLIDDLRDYRFYNADLVHPTDSAIAYVWGQFAQTYFDETTMQINKKVRQIQEAMQHRPFFPESDQHKEFLKSQLLKTKALKREHPFLDLSEETTYFNS
ncbi:MAG: GSCFA domain-containing protein [Bacteroidota bacterium]